MAAQFRILPYARCSYGIGALSHGIILDGLSIRVNRTETAPGERAKVHCDGCSFVATSRCLNQMRSVDTTPTGELRHARGPLFGRHAGSTPSSLIAPPRLKAIFLPALLRRRRVQLRSARFHGSRARRRLACGHPLLGPPGLAHPRQAVRVVLEHLRLQPRRISLMCRCRAELPRESP